MKESIGAFEELVLLLVAAQHDQAYGVTILQEMQDRLNKKANISSIHVTLKRLETKGMVHSRIGGITSDRGGRRKKFYVITTLGKSVLDQQYAVRTTLYGQIPNLGLSNG